VCGVAAHKDCLPKLAEARAADCKRVALRPGSMAPPAPMLAAASSSSWDHLGDAALRRASNSQASGLGPPENGGLPLTPTSGAVGPTHRRAGSGFGLSTSPPPEVGRARERDRGWARMAHHWVSTPEGWDEGGDDKGAPLTTKCLVCRTPCRAGLLAPEPLYRCIWCAAFAHGECVAATVRAAAGGPGPAGDAAAGAAAGARHYCTLGVYRHMVVPPVYVRELPRPGALPEPARAAGGFGSNWHSQEIVNKAMQKAAQLRRRARRKLSRSANGGGGGGSHGGRNDSSNDLLAAAAAEAEATAAVPPRPPAAAYELLRLPAEARPLLVFVNRRSGPQAGGALIRRLKQALNPLQVWELPGEHGGPEAALALFARVPRLRIAVCGGDGTAGWVLAALDDLWERASLGPEVAKPPVAILPLGTGNDLARCLSWAASDGWGLEKGAPDVDRFLHDVDRSTVALLDRWSLRIAEPGGAPGACVRKLMNNYFSIGMDAKVALDFHSTREAHPDWFQSQAGNKLWYTGVAAGELLTHSCQGLPKNVRIECDGQPLVLPPEVEGVVVLNIGSYMGGVELWKSGRHGSASRLPSGSANSDGSGESDSDDDGISRAGLGPQAMNDRLVEVVGHYGTWHLGKLHIGMSRALQLAQCSTVRITTAAPLPMQVDGEPWMQEEPCVLTIEHHSQALMLRRSRGEGDGAVMGVVSSVLDQAATEGFLSTDQHRALVTEIARRLPQ
jgi:diacylglycerol kinase (ATP)